MNGNNLVWYQKIAAAVKTQLWRLVVALIFVLIAIYYVIQNEFFPALLAINVSIQALFIGALPNKHFDQEFVPDVMAELKIEQDMLHVKQRQFKVTDIKKVALDQLDNENAFIDFPFNVYRAAAMRFPASQLPAVKAWVQQHLPQAEIIR